MKSKGSEVDNPVMCFDIGYRIEGDQPCLFILDDLGRELTKFVGHTGPYICSDQELMARDWCQSRGAQVNYLPSWLRHCDEVTLHIMRLSE